MNKNYIVISVAVCIFIGYYIFFGGVPNQHGYIMPQYDTIQIPKADSCDDSVLIYPINHSEIK